MNDYDIARDLIRAWLIGAAVGIILWILMAGVLRVSNLIHSPEPDYARIDAITAFKDNEAEAVRETDPLVELRIRRQQVRLATQFCLDKGK